MASRRCIEFRVGCHRTAWRRVEMKPPRIDEVQPSTLTGDLYSPSVIVLRSGRRCPGRTPAAITPQLLGVNDVEQLFA
jgi:hypothetical protein